jgi:hypothetical protein
MSRAHKALQARRERLIARAEEQRQEIAEEVGALHAMAERARSRLIGLKRIAPLLGIGAGVAALVMMRGRGLTRVVRGGFKIWQFVQRLR